MPWPFTTRMTVVQLASGDLFLHSPIAFDAALAKRAPIAGPGPPPRFPQQGPLCAHRGVGARISEAIAWASPGVRERARSQACRRTVPARSDTQAPPDWRDDIDQTIIPGAVLDEVVFFTGTPKTLIVADTIMNFEPERLSQPYRPIARLLSISSPGGGLSPDLRLAFWPKKRAVRRAYEQVPSWRPQRVILSHGRCFDANGGIVIWRAFRWALGG